MLKWIFYVRPEGLPEDYIPEEDPEDTLFTMATRNLLVREIPVSLRRSVVASLH